MESQSLAGEVAVVTGGAGGIAAAVAATFAAAGARVCIADLEPARAGEVAETLGPSHMGIDLDVRSWDSVHAAVRRVDDRLGPATILFNGAGIQRVRPTVDMTPEDWEVVLDVNLSGTFRCCQAFGTAMVERGHGAIINVASVTGIEFGGGGRVAYGASKGGIAGLTRTLGVEWAPRGVRVNAIAPGIVATPLVLGLAAEGSLDLDDLAGRVPAGRVATPEDIAGLALLLASPAGAYVVGQTLLVDGGLTSAGPRDTSRDAPARPSTPVP